MPIVSKRGLKNYSSFLAYYSILKNLAHLVDPLKVKKKKRNKKVD